MRNKMNKMEIKEEGETENQKINFSIYFLFHNLDFEACLEVL